MKNQYKRIAILSLMGIILGTMPSASALASSMETSSVETTSTESNSTESLFTENTVVITEETSEITEEVLISEEITEATTDEAATANSEKENTSGKEVTSEKEKINYKTEILTITKSGFVADSFNGVDALYRKNGYDGSNATYSCAAYIKRYYKEVYGVTVMNLFGGATPSSSKGKFKAVKTPKVGDIVACSSTSGSNHWAIVKKVNDNNTVTLIEQNWKWSQGGQTVCKINRTISNSSAAFYRLYK